MPQLEENTTILVKFICAILFHLKFEAEIRNGIQMIKYAVLHWDYFEYPIAAASTGLINALIIILVEVINLWNLANITEGVYDLIFDFIALGIIAEFDDYFLEVYRFTEMRPLFDGMNIRFERSKTIKRERPSPREERMEKVAQKIKQYLKSFEKLVKKISEDEGKEKELTRDTSEDCCECFSCCSCCWWWDTCFKTCIMGEKVENELEKLQHLQSMAIVNIVEFRRLFVLNLHAKMKQ